MPAATNRSRVLAGAQDLGFKACRRIGTLFRGSLYAGLWCIRVHMSAVVNGHYITGTMNSTAGKPVALSSKAPTPCCQIPFRCLHPQTHVVVSMFFSTPWRGYMSCSLNSYSIPLNNLGSNPLYSPLYNFL